MNNRFAEYKGLDLPVVADEILKYWKENDIFQKSIETREGKTPYIFFEGPPSANGLPGIHHVMARAIKDIFCRYKTQKGFQVKRKAGWDTHGLPVELGTEKELGITKEDIGVKISVEEYNEACKRTVMRYTDVWNDLTEKMGYWVDMENPYITYKSKYMESVWWLLKQIYDKNLLYKGYTIQPYSPKAGTGLSSHELNQPGTYRDVTDTTIIAQFKAKNETLPNFLQGFGDIHFLAWTTTPWTLPSNTALTVGPNIDYVLVKTFNQYTSEKINVVLAKNLINKVFSGKFIDIKNDTRLVDVLNNSTNLEEFHEGLNEEISELKKAIIDSKDNPEKSEFFGFETRLKKLEEIQTKKIIPYTCPDFKEFKGKDLKDIRYEQLIPVAEPYQKSEDAFRVILGDFVTTEDGTGIVHTAPTFGADDAKVAAEANPPVPPMLVSTVENKNEFIDKLYSNRYISPASTYVFLNYISNKSTSKLFKEENIFDNLNKIYKEIIHNASRTNTFIDYKPIFLDITQKIKKNELSDLIEDDYWKAAREGQLVPLVNLQGKFIDEIKTLKYNNGEELILSGKYVKNEYYLDGEAPEKSVDVEIAIRLKEENKAFKVEKYVHSYPHCWRTDKPILYYPLDSWFIKVTEVKDRMFELNETINWKPKATGEGRFGNWLKNANDWNLSRSRYWGIPLPIWRTEDKTEEICIGSVEELINEINKSVEKGLMSENPFKNFAVGDLSEENYDLIDLHKNVVDKIVLVSESEKPMNRETDLIDVWFDSGAMPYAQWHYPFTQTELPREADFIAEGVDQTRGWFYTLHAIGVLVFDRITYKNVVSNGLVLDKNGQKMSKRLGNAADPFETLKEYGADATRWYMISNANPWDNLKFDLDGIAEVRRKFFGTLYNTYSFFALYANIDGFNYSENEVPLSERPEIDRWILSELNSLIKFVDESYNDYEPTKATRAISDFVQENLSNWYVRLCRRRFWKGDYSTDKISAYQTLYTCLEAVAKLIAPVAPFYAEKLYKDLNTVTEKETFESVHLSDFPKSDESAIDKALERRMQNAQTISSLVLSLRKKEMIKVRQPLQKVMIPVLDESQKQDIQMVEDLIKAEVNVKEIELLDDASGVLVKQIKPNFKALGPRFGKDMGLISKAIQAFTQEQINELEKKGEISLGISENSIILSSQEVEITSQDIPGWLVASDNGITVALDITISDELRKEGIARELVNRIQNIRKESGFEVTDKIKVEIQTEAEIAEAVQANLEYIKTETLTRELKISDKVENGTEIEFDGFTTRILISK